MSGAMAALLGLSFDQAVEAANEASKGQVCQAANDNDPGQVVVSGHREAVERACEIAKGMGAKRALLLPVSAPFHCALMEPAAQVMAEALAGVEIRAPQVPLVANVMAHDVSDPEVIRRRSGAASDRAQCAGARAWRSWRRDGVTEFWEIGAGKALSGMIKRSADGVTTQAVGTPEDVAAALALTQAGVFHPRTPGGYFRDNEAARGRATAVAGGAGGAGCYFRARRTDKGQRCLI